MTSPGLNIIIDLTLLDDEDDDENMNDEMVGRLGMMDVIVIGRIKLFVGWNIRKGKSIGVNTAATVMMTQINHGKRYPFVGLCGERIIIAD